METQVIPQKAIDALVAAPDKAAGFDRVFGAGRAAEVLSAQKPQAPKVPKADEMSFIRKTWDATGKAVSFGVQEAVNETVDAVESFDTWASGHLDNLGVPSRLQLWETNEDGTLGDFKPQLKFYRDSVGDKDFLGGRVGVSGDAVQSNFVPKPSTVTGGIVGGVSQFVAGFAAAGKFTKLSGLRGAFVNGAIADAIVFNPDDPNITAMLEGFDIDTGVLGDVLATNPDDPEYINRLRNAAEGVVAGGVVEAIGWSIRAARAKRAGDNTAAKEFVKQQDEALKVLDGEMATAAKDVTDDLEETLKFSEGIFKEEPDGQLRMDLGEEPQARPTPKDGTEPAPKRIYITPEKHEQIRAWAEGTPWFRAGDKQDEFSFRSLTTAKDFDEVLDEMTAVKNVLKDQFDSIKGGNVQRWKTVQLQAAAKLRQMAQMSGEDPEALVSKFLSADLGDTSKVAAEILARSRYLLTIEEELKAMAKAIDSGVMDPKVFPGIRDMHHLKLAFSQRREVAANLLAGQDALRSNVARAMNAMKIAVKGDKNLRDLLKDPNLFRDVDAMARAVADPKNAGSSAVKVANDTAEGLRGFLDKVNTLRINALLSGPGTQEVNFISNVVNSLAIPSEQALGSIASGDLRMLKHAMRQFQGQFLGSIDAARTALQAGWNDKAILDQFSAKVDTEGLHQGKSISSKVINTPTRLLMSMDELFKQGQYRGRVFADAHDEAALKGLKGDDKSDFIKQYIAESYDESGAALRGDALLQARRATFTEPLDPGVASMLQVMAIKSPVIRFIVPFVRTPVNILSQTVQHVPVVGALSKRWRDDIAAGGARRAQAIGKWVVGSGLIAMAGHLAATGQITGSGPSDPRIRKVWLQNNQPYAFRLDNEDGSVSWVSFARLEPLSNLFSISADVVELTNDEYNDVESRGLMMALFLATMENTVNKTFTQGIYDAMSIMVGNKQHEREAAMRNFVTSFVPNVLNQTNGDEVMRDVRSYTDAFMNKTHLYNGVDPKRNVLGEPVIRRLPKYDPLGLTDDDTRDVDEVLKEVTRVAIINQSVADNPAKKLPGPSKTDLTQVPYSDTQSVYDRWVELTGTVKIGGKTLREELAATIKSPVYIRAPDGDVGVNRGTKGARIRKVITAYREKAKSELPELRELIKADRSMGVSILKKQKETNRELFPLTETPERSIRRRTFEDLLGE